MESFGASSGLSRGTGLTLNGGGIRDGQNVSLVHDRLRDAILRGEIRPGQVTSQVLLADSLGVSRTPLREAVRMLQSEGLIVVEPNKRIRIAEFSISDLEQLYAMRIALEALAIRATIPALGPEDPAELEGFLAQMSHYVRAGDFDRMQKPHAAFHARLVSGGGPRMSSELAQLWDHAERYRRAYNLTPEARGPEDRTDEHRAILDAVVSQDVDLAVARLIIHYVRTATMVVANLEPSHDPVLLRTAITAAMPAATPVEEVRTAMALINGSQQ